MGVADAGFAVGASMDAVSLDTDHLSLIGRRGDALLDGWIFAARTSPISDVWRAGRRVVAGGRHVAKDAIGARYRAVVRRLLAS